MAGAAVEATLEVAQAARIKTLEEELVIAEERARSEGDELEDLRRQLRAKEIAHQQVTAAERLTKAELVKSSGEAQKLEETVSAQAAELRARDLDLQKEREGRRALAERLTEKERQLGEATTRLTQAGLAEQAAREQAASAETAKRLAEDAARKDLDAAAEAGEAKVAIAREAAMGSEKLVSELQVQLAAAQDVARSQAAETLKLREAAAATTAELDARDERLRDANRRLENMQDEMAKVSSERSEAAHEVWEGELQQRLRREQAEALETRMRFLQTELATKDERLRTAEREAADLRGSLRSQQAKLAEVEQTLQKVRVIEMPAMREHLRREESRAAASEAKLVAVEGQLSASSLSLAEARQAAIDREQAVAQARSLQLAAELRLADADQRVAAEARRAAAAEAEAHGAVERHAALQDAHAGLRALLRQKEEQLAELRQREMTRAEIQEPLAQKALDEAKEKAAVLTASLKGKEEQHTVLLETLGSLRRAIAEREAKVHELTERVNTLETVELLNANEAAAAAKEKAAQAAVATKGAELRCSEVQARFDDSQSHIASLSAQLAQAEEGRHTAEAQSVLQEGVAAAAKSEAAQILEQLRGETVRAEELTKELRLSREETRAKAAQLTAARSEADAALVAKETAEEAVALEAQRARSAAFELEMAKASLAEEQSKLKLLSVEVASRDSQIAELSVQRSAAREKLGVRTEHADELHERLRLAAIAGTETEAELVMLRARLTELERAVQAKDEQIEMARLKLKATSDDGRATTNAAQSLATRAEAMAEDLRVKEEQLALLKQSINVMEEEMLAKDSSADATKEKLALLQKECATRDDEILVLSEQLQAAHLEIKVGGSALGRKNEELEQQLAGTQDALAQAQRQLEQHLLSAARDASSNLRKAREAPIVGGPDTLGFFHNTAILVKGLLARNQTVGNVPIDELYEHVVNNKVPIEEWPHFIYERVSAVA